MQKFSQVYQLWKLIESEKFQQGKSWARCTAQYQKQPCSGGELYMQQASTLSSTATITEMYNNISVQLQPNILLSTWCAVYASLFNKGKQCIQHCSIVGWDWVQYCTECPAEHLVWCVLCMFLQFSKDKCKPVTEICRTPPNARYLGMEMFNLVYNHPPPPPLKY